MSASLDPRWPAVVARDRAADFFYAVATTGVYCRPACAARTPNPKNVTFHATPADAVAAGYRACLRCRPDEPVGARHAELVAAACRRLEAEDVTLAELAADAGMSPHHFHRVFKAVAGLTPRAWAAQGRNRELRSRLRAGATVTDAIRGAGFSSTSRAYGAGALGMTPGAFRAGGAGMRIRFAVGDCALGYVIVAATDTGVCAIFLGDSPDDLVRALEDRFPRAELVGGNAAFEATVAQVVALVDGRGSPELPLDLRGTAFQRRVWDALRRIPAGTTATYAEIAAAIGEPTSSRAVAQACGANPVAVIVPCHRVVRSDGGISGYRWGIERKRALLAREIP